LKVGELEFSHANEWKSIVRNFDKLMVQDLNISDSQSFTNEMMIDNLIVHGKINGMNCGDMFEKWLTAEGEQTFTTTQTLDSLKVDGNVLIKSQRLNEIDLGQIIEESIWIDEIISVDTIESNDVITSQKRIIAPLVNGATLIDKLIRNNTQEQQYIKKIKVRDSCVISHLNFENINEINHKDFVNAFNGNDEIPNIKINGNAMFNMNSSVTFLNDINLQELYDNAWLTNRDVTLIGDDIQFLGESRVESILYADVSFSFF
jgi:hypothetical protein